MRIMRTMTVTFALGTALWAFCAAPLSQARVVREPRTRLVVRPPVVLTPTPWDYNIVPRYRYRPEDDRVDPYAPPPVPVIRAGNQEIVLPAWNWW